MNSRERVAAALRREEPDRVPYCELGIDRSLAETIMGWGKQDGQQANLEANIYSVEEAKAIASFMHMDNINYVLRAPVYAKKSPGDDGRLEPFASGMEHGRNLHRPLHSDAGPRDIGQERHHPRLPGGLLEDEY